MLAAQGQRNRELFAHRVRIGVVRHRAKVRAERRGDWTIPFLAEQDVFGVVIDPRQDAQHVADIRADAEVVELSGVYRNAHANGPSAAGTVRERRRAQRMRAVLSAWRPLVF